jgi:NAD(P)H-dependent FMN reductase
MTDKRHSLGAIQLMPDMYREERMRQQNNSSVQMPLVVGICGSLREGSYTRMAVKVALQGAEELGAKTLLIDLREYDLPFCTGQETEYPPTVFKLREAIRPAQGIILGTPEYHGSFSGVLKNALDLMAFSEFEGKMIGLVGISGGRMGAFHALNSLRTIGRSLHAWVIPEQASIGQAWKVFDEEGKMKDSGLEKRVKEVGSQVARFAHLHSCGQAQDFLNAWVGAPTNPGGDN